MCLAPASKASIVSWKLAMVCPIATTTPRDATSAMIVASTSSDAERDGWTVRSGGRGRGTLPGGRRGLEWLSCATNRGGSAAHNGTYGRLLGGGQAPMLPDMRSLSSREECPLWSAGGWTIRAPARDKEVCLHASLAFDRYLAAGFADEFLVD